MICMAVLACAGSAMVSAEPTPAVKALKEREAKIRAVAEKSLPAVVAITTAQPIGTGSGVIVSKDGLILTAAHVTDAITEEDPDRNVVIIFPDGKQVKGQVLGANRSCDAAMVKITEPAGQEWPHVELGTSDDKAKGDWVVAMGQPGGFEQDRLPPVRAGRIWGRDNFGAFFTDCTLVGGDSGGPLFDLDGKLVGIHSSIGGPLTINRHVGIDNFRTDWDRLLKGEVWGELVLGEADPDRPVIGAQLDEDSTDGVKVVDVVAEGPAAKAGVEKGDVITRFGGEPVKNYLSFIRLVSRRGAGDDVALTVRRGEKDERDLKIQLLSRAQLRSLDQRIELPPAPKVWFGAEVEDAKPGATVTDVSENSPAAASGLKKGDVILQLDGKDVPDAIDLAKNLLSRQPDAPFTLKVRRPDGTTDLSATLKAR